MIGGSNGVGGGGARRDLALGSPSRGLTPRSPSAGRPHSRGRGRVEGAGWGGVHGMARRWRSRAHGDVMEVVARAVATAAALSPSVVRAPAMKGSMSQAGGGGWRTAALYALLPLSSNAATGAQRTFYFSFADEDEDARDVSHFCWQGRLPPTCSRLSRLHLLLACPGKLSSLSV